MLRSIPHRTSRFDWNVALRFVNMGDNSLLGTYPRGVDRNLTRLSSEHEPMKRIVLTLLVVASLTNAASAAEDLAQSFSRPPQSARPWVYWFPLSGNLSK